MDIRLLEVFQQVAAHGSFTAAASALCYTQSAVSRQIATLEADLGQPLFDRLTRGVRLTTYGRAFLPHAEVVLRRLADARKDLDELRDRATGQLRVGAFSGAAALLPSAVAAFRRDWPGVRVWVGDGTAAAQLSRLDAGEIDLAVVDGYPGEALDDTKYDVQRLLDEPMMLAMSADHRLANRPAVDLAELADESWIVGGPAAEQALPGACLAAGFRPRIEVVAGDWSARREFVVAGLGVTLVPALSAISAPGALAVLPLAGAALPTRTIYLASASGISDSPAMAAFRRTISNIATTLTEPARAA